MKAYVVFTREKMHDESAFQEYQALVPASRNGHEVTALARYGRVEVLEGSPVEGVVILEFPNFEAAKAWYDSPLYREAREHRFRAAEYRSMIVEGL
jgi:uncharacterized protein (DUF1330 family)